MPRSKKTPAPPAVTDQAYYGALDDAMNRALHRAAEADMQACRAVDAAFERGRIVQWYIGDHLQTGVVEDVAVQQVHRIGIKVRNNRTGAVKWYDVYRFLNQRRQD